MRRFLRSNEFRPDCVESGNMWQRGHTPDSARITLFFSINILMLLEMCFAGARGVLSNKIAPSLFEVFKYL